MKTSPVDRRGPALFQEVPVRLHVATDRHESGRSAPHAEHGFAVIRAQPRSHAPGPSNQGRPVAPARQEIAVKVLENGEHRARPGPGSRRPLASGSEPPRDA